jgi:hypothetical protein
MTPRVQNAVALVSLLTAATAALCGCVASCPAIQYLDMSPVVVEFTKPAPSDVVVSACFGEDCQPAEVPVGRDGRWEVPQEAPYLDESSVSNGKPLHVIVDYGTHATDDVYQIPTTPDHPGTLGGCGKPWHYEPVVISAP